ncbi:MAG: hypothetical protein IKY30_03460 [Oscillospiraceae bacterium]|nr:hypothetical protein [Oscillospiraceae bacterium]
MKVYKAPNRKRKISALAVCLLLTAMLTIGGTLAYLFTQTTPVVNTFNPVTPDITVDEGFDGNVKKEVKITNTGEVDSYIRAKVVITWQDATGKVYPLTPVVGTDADTADYKITWNVSDTVVKDAWIKGSDGFYYYTSAVPVGDSTGILFTDAAPLRACADENYTLHIEILSQSIQSTPDEAVNQTWTNITASNGILTAVR